MSNFCICILLSVCATSLGRRVQRQRVLSAQNADSNAELVSLSGDQIVHDFATQKSTTVFIQDKLQSTDGSALEFDPEAIRWRVTLLYRGAAVPPDQPIFLGTEVNDLYNYGKWVRSSGRSYAQHGEHPVAESALYIAQHHKELRDASIERPPPAAIRWLCDTLNNMRAEAAVRGQYKRVRDWFLVLMQIARAGSLSGACSELAATGAALVEPWPDASRPSLGYLRSAIWHVKQGDIEELQSIGNIAQSDCVLVADAALEDLKRLPGYHDSRMAAGEEEPEAGAEESELETEREEDFGTGAGGVAEGGAGGAGGGAAAGGSSGGASGAGPPAGVRYPFKSAGGT